MQDEDPLGVAAIHDLVVKGEDLVLATHGRAFWILDDVSPLRQWNDTVAKADVHLFTPDPAYRFRGGSHASTFEGRNPPAGAILYYQLAKAQASVSLDVRRIRLKAREEVVTAVMSAAQAEIDAVRKRSDYPKVLAGLIAEALRALDGDEFVVYADARDLGLLESAAFPAARELKKGEGRAVKRLEAKALARPDGGGRAGRRAGRERHWDPDRCNNRDGGPHRPEGAGVYPRCVSPYGVLDMVGSVWEYCADFYDDKYYQTAPERDPKGPVSGRLCVSRGGSWLEANTWTRTALRQGIEPSWRDTGHGFRCAMDAGK